MEYRDLLDLALAAARAATDVHRRHLGHVDIAHWRQKGASDFVTHVDREAEEVIVRMIRDSVPDHAILAEEGTAGPDEGGAAVPGEDAEWLWVIDPLDGTTNFLHRYPAFAASVAVLHHGEPVAGAVVDGSSGQAWTAHRGGGAFLDGEPIRVSEIDHLPNALIGTGFPFKRQELIPDYLRQFDVVLRNTSGVRRAGSAALDLCHVATGCLDGFWELVLAPWDIAAGVVIVREAGGIVTALDGAPLDLRKEGPVLAGNPAIHDALAALISRDR